MNARYDEFLRHRRLVQQLESASTPDELGRALIELGIEIWGVEPSHIIFRYPELVCSVHPAKETVLPEHIGA